MPNIIIADKSYKLSELAAATANEATDIFYVVKIVGGEEVAYKITRAQLLSGLAGTLAVENNGTAVGNASTLNFVPGTNITFNITDAGSGQIDVEITAAGGSGTVAWGAITGTLADQTDLQNALDAKLNLDQTTPQTIENGIPLLDADLADFNHPKQLVNVEFVANATNLISDYYFTNVADAIGGIYYQMKDTDPNLPAVTLTTGTLGTGTDQPVFNFINDVALGFTILKSGIYEVHTHALKTGTKSAALSCELYIRDTGGTETLVGASLNASNLTLTDAEYDLTLSVPTSININATDKLVVKFFVDVGASGGNVTVSLNLEGSNNSRLSVPVESSLLSQIFVRQDGTKPLTGDWDAGGFEITGAILDSFENFIAADRQHLNVLNDSGVFIGQGQPVYITGYNFIGTAAPTIALADASSAATMPCIGLTQETMGDGSFGSIVIGGEMTFNTSSFSNGDVLYVDTTAGGLITTPPTGTGVQVQKIGIVHLAAGSGKVQVLSYGVEANLGDFITESDVINTARLYTKGQALETVVLTSATATVDYDLADGNAFELTLTEDTELQIPTWNAGAFPANHAQSYQIEVIQDGTGGRALTFDAAYKWQGGTAPTLPTTAGDKYLLNMSRVRGGDIYISILDPNS